MHLDLTSKHVETPCVGRFERMQLQTFRGKKKTLHPWSTHWCTSYVWLFLVNARTKTTRSVPGHKGTPLAIAFWMFAFSIISSALLAAWKRVWTACECSVLWCWKSFLLILSRNLSTLSSGEKTTTWQGKQAYHVKMPWKHVFKVTRIY